VGAVVADIRAEGATPYLQVKADNEPALALYRSMGFETARAVTAVALQRPAP
jgi:ribosomal protein S18 acetylase RimI-like enzyme